MALVYYAMKVAKIPPERIIIQGQSLGTAVATAVAEYFALRKGVEFQALILVAPFEDIPSLMLTYAIGGVIPILSPLRSYPFLQNFFRAKIKETWFTAERLDRWVRSSNRVRLFLIHARNDFEIPWKHSERLFHVAANATSSGKGLTGELINKMKWHQDLGQSGWVDVWKAGEGEKGRKDVRLEIVAAGGKSFRNIDPRRHSDRDFEKAITALQLSRHWRERC